MTGSENLVGRRMKLFFSFLFSFFFFLLPTDVFPPPSPPFSHQNLSRAVTGTKLS